MKLRELQEREMVETVGGCFVLANEFAHPSIVNLCGSSAFGGVDRAFVQPGVREVAKDGVNTYLENYQPPIPARIPGTEPSISGLSSSEINSVYSHSRYMDGHEVRNRDPYDRWP